MIIPADYESYDYNTVDEMVTFGTQMGFKYYDMLPQEEEHTEVDSFVSEEGQAPVELLIPDLKCC